MSITNPRPSQADAAGSNWAWGSMFWLGTLSGGSQATRQYHRRAYGALGLLVLAVSIGIAMDTFLGTRLSRWPVGVGTPLAFAYILLSFHRYVHELDELAQRLQFEAVLLAFLFVILAGIVLGSVWVFTGWVAHPVWVLLAEPVRGVGLIVAARRYR
jgi:heme/copper-type cytochrome/quinol oxidase subunit 4